LLHNLERKMRFPLALVVATAFTASSAGALAQSAQDHAAHHPDGVSAPAASSNASPATPAQMDQQMRSMQEIYIKLMAAKTPEEHQALMSEHMKAMKGGMAMMGQMHSPNAKSGGMPMSPEAMAQRMDMMEMMMQMMVDREADRAPAAK